MISAFLSRQLINYEIWGKIKMPLVHMYTKNQLSLCLKVVLSLNKGGDNSEETPDTCCLQSRWSAVIKGCRSGCYRIRVNTPRASLCLQQVICISCYGIQISSGWQRVTFEYSLTVCLPFLIRWPERQQKCHSWVFHHPSAELCFLSVVSHTHSATLWIRKAEDRVVFLWPCRLFCCSLWIWIRCFNSSLRHLTVAPL